MHDTFVIEIKSSIEIIAIPILKFKLFISMRLFIEEWIYNLVATCNTLNCNGLSNKERMPWSILKTFTDKADIHVMM